MNISDSSFIMGSGVGNSIRTTQKNSESVSEGGSYTKSNTSANSDIVQVSEGQKFRGEITGITGDKINIMLENNKILSARMNEAVNMNIGDRLVFQVKENTGSNVVISPVMEGLGNMKDSAIFSILEMNGFSPTDKNYSIAESLLNNNMSVDRTSMQKLMQQSYKFPDASIDALVQLTKMKMPINEATINQYNAYMSNSHQLSNDIIRFSDAISNLQSQLTGEIFNLSGSFEAMLDVNDQLLKILSDEADLPVNTGNAQGADGLIGEQQANLQTEPELMDTSVQQKLQNAVSGQNIQAAAEGAADVSKELILGEPNSNQEAIAMSGDAADKDGASIIDKNDIALDNKTGLDSELLKSFTERLKAMGLDKNSIQNIINNSDSTMKLLNTLSGELKNMHGLPAEKLKELFDSNEYRQILERGIRDKFVLNPKNMKTPSEVDGLYKGIYEKANKLMQTFSGGGGNAGGQLQQQAKNVVERIEFINNLNNMFTYAQLPVRMNSGELNSELFVYMNKRNLRENKEQVSALLHLDMDHLGPTDVHVSLHGGIVHTRFYVEDEESARIIDEHMNMLEKAINESGFQHTNEVIRREPTLNTQPNEVVSNMFDSELEKSVKRYTFDMRM